VEKVERLGSRVVAIVVAMAAFVVLFLDLVAGGFACGTDTAYCALTREKNGYYEATLPAVQQGAPLQVSLESLRGEEPVRFTAGPGGSVCIVWAQEHVTPFVTANGQTTGLQHWQSGQPPPGCQTSDVAIPWNRAEGVTSRWQYKLIIAAPGLALLLLGLSAFFPLPWKGRLRYAGSAMVAVAIAVALIV
jgi:hypothetical protein